MIAASYLCCVSQGGGGGPSLCSLGFKHGGEEAVALKQGITACDRSSLHADRWGPPYGRYHGEKNPIHGSPVQPLVSFDRTTTQ